MSSTLDWIAAHPGCTLADLPAEPDAISQAQLRREVALLRDQGRIRFHSADRVDPVAQIKEGGWFVCQEDRRPQLDPA